MVKNKIITEISEPAFCPKSKALLVNNVRISENIKKTTIPSENKIIIKKYSLNTFDSPLVKKLIRMNNSKHPSQPIITITFTEKIIPIKHVVIITREF